MCFESFFNSIQLDGFLEGLLIFSRPIILNVIVVFYLSTNRGVLWKLSEGLWRLFYLFICGIDKNVSRVNIFLNIRISFTFPTKFRDRFHSKKKSRKSKNSRKSQKFIHANINMYKAFNLPWILVGDGQLLKLMK